MPGETPSQDGASVFEESVLLALLPLRDMRRPPLSALGLTA